MYEDFQRTVPYSPRHLIAFEFLFYPMYEDKMALSPLVERSGVRGILISWFSRTVMYDISNRIVF